MDFIFIVVFIQLEETFNKDDKKWLIRFYLYQIHMGLITE